MAIAEHEVAQKLTLSLTQEQAAKLRQAAAVQGQGVEEFVISSSVQAASAALTAGDALLSPAKSFASVLGIFQNEPLMDTLMERIHEERTKQAAQEAEN